MQENSNIELIKYQADGLEKDGDRAFDNNQISEANKLWKKAKDLREKLKSPKASIRFKKLASKIME